MQVNTVESISAYLAFLRQHPAEAHALLDDLLISVTNFFRDPQPSKRCSSTFRSCSPGRGR
jgi:two-component system CheB/CheR fusion protein